jgi:hypothetical protein
LEAYNSTYSLFLEEMVGMMMGWRWKGREGKGRNALAYFKVLAMKEGGE